MADERRCIHRRSILHEESISDVALLCWADVLFGCENHHSVNSWSVANRSPCLEIVNLFYLGITMDNKTTLEFCGFAIGAMSAFQSPSGRKDSHVWSVVHIFPCFQIALQYTQLSLHGTPIFCFERTTHNHVPVRIISIVLQSFAARARGSKLLMMSIGEHIDWHQLFRG